MKDWIVNVLTVAGIILTAYGFWLAYRPAGYIAAGLALVLVAIAFARADESNRRTQ